MTCSKITELSIVHALGKNILVYTISIEIFSQVLFFTFLKHAHFHGNLKFVAKLVSLAVKIILKII